MSTDLRAEYDLLTQAAAGFGQEADRVKSLTQKLGSQAEVLQRAWIGQGAEAFQRDMGAQVLPEFKRLHQALGATGAGLKQISQIFQTGEQEAASYFNFTATGAGGETNATSTTPNIPADDTGWTWPKWLTDLLDGVFLGDFSENSSLLKLLAQIGVGFIPIAGQIADARDIIAGIKNVIEGKEGAWIALGLSLLAIIPGLDALKAGKALKPVFKAMGDKGTREFVEFILKNPKEVGRVAKTLGTVVKNPEIIEALVKNPDTALRLLREGTPEVVEAFGKYGDEAFNLLKGIPIPKQVFDDAPMRIPQRGLDPINGPMLTPDVPKFVTPGVHGDFDQFPISKYPVPYDGKDINKLLYTIDGNGAHFIPENGFSWPSSRGMPSHTNISDNAYFGGEAWRTGPNEITLNAGSGAFGYNRNVANSLSGAKLEEYLADCQARYDHAAEYFRQLGFEVKQVPLTTRDLN